MVPVGSIFSHKGQGIFLDENESIALIGFLNSSTARALLGVIAPTLMSFEAGHISDLPTFHADTDVDVIDSIVNDLIAIFRGDWNVYETSWDFEVNPLVAMGVGSLDVHSRAGWYNVITTTDIAQQLETRNNHYFAKLYGLDGEVPHDVPLSRISLTQNPYFRYAPTKGSTRTDAEYRTLFDRDLARELISYAVGCMMGRYSLDRPGLILADAQTAVADFDKKVPDTRFPVDADGIIPITAERYFEDDIVTRLREFLVVAFGRQHLEANVSWLEHALGNGRPISLPKYFLERFYDDHVKMYSKRPIYWQASSPKGGFNALFYLHRYTSATLGLIHQSYAEEYVGKLSARVETIDHAVQTADGRESTRLGRERDALNAEIREVSGWIDRHLFPLATAGIELDLDDGVKQNYPKLAGVVKKVTGL